MKAEVEMKKWNNKSFLAIVTFLIVLSVFGAINLWTVVDVPECCDQIDSVGFPLAFFESGGFAGLTNYRPMLLVTDIVIALAVSAAGAWAVLRLGGAGNAP